MDAEQFRGLKAELRLCIDCRVLLNTNKWVAAGLANGATGWVRGFMFPLGFDPSADDTALSTPLCVIVEFDEVNLGKHVSGYDRSFFSGDASKVNYVPI